ncbi:Vacuolar protein sorting-associated protein 11 [Polyrhizophydium stewartii]|uniref:Vacuolar protein sorting-associated protein 11 n=1 Tax=Polyrhizophydium stewartii TaxID=2732419 RepID=A0ABR4NBT2_9FUNG
MLVFGDEQGYVHFMNQTFAVVASFKAHATRVTHIKQMRRKPILFTIGEDDSSTPTLKTWNIDKDVVEKTGAAVLVQSKKIVHKAKVFPVTAFAALENLSQLAIGLENGVVMVHRGDLSRARYAKTVVVHEGSETVTGLGFHEDGAETTLYIVTLARIVTCVTSNKDTKSILEEQGAEIGLSLVTPTERGQEMAMARSEAVYFYGPDGRGPCFLIDGEKSLMAWFRGYLVLVSKEAPLRSHVLTEFGNASDSAFTPEPDAQLSRSWQPGGPTPGHLLTIYDLKSKFVAYRGSFGTRRFDASVGTAVGEPIHHVLSEWGELLVITKENKMFRLREMDLDSKLELLYSKNMYNLAVSILTHPAGAVHTVGLRGAPSDLGISSPSLAAAVAPGAGDAPLKPAETSQYVIMDIYKRYGDHLYSRGDFDSSMKQYIKTIGNLEPSYVIRKFLDAQRIYNLTSYLQALHDQQLANPNHTTLLLNCYTKLKDVARLDAFINNPKALFDVETAIRVCRQAGYYTHALRLAARFEQHEWHLRMQIEDLHVYDEALAYLAKLPRQQVRRALPSYGYLLVKNRPRQATEALIRACTASASGGGSASAAAAAAAAAMTAASASPLPGAKQSATASLLAASEAASTDGRSSPEPRAASAASDNDLANPQDFLPFFVGQPMWCITFIENVLRKRWGLGKDGKEPSGDGTGAHAAADAHAVHVVPQDADALTRQVLWDTLLELYLDQHSGEMHGASAMTAGTSSSTATAVTMTMTTTTTTTTVTKTTKSTATGKTTMTSTVQSTAPATTVQSVSLSPSHPPATLQAPQTPQPPQPPPQPPQPPPMPPRHNWPRKIMSVLQNAQANYDADQALVLCKTHQFRDGVLYLLRRLGLYHDYLDFHMQRQEYAQVLKACQNFGDHDPSMWTKALIFFVEKGVRESAATGGGGGGGGGGNGATAAMAANGSKAADGAGSSKELLEVLEQIAKRKLLSQLQIVRLLSKNSAVTLGMVRDFLVKRIEADMAAIDESTRLITSYRDETAKMRSEIAELETGTMTFQATRCELCRQPLELPTVHFYCRHAFHQRCLGDQDGECPRCSGEQHIIQEMVRTQRLNARRHDLFVQKLAEGSEHEDKFAMIAEYFSKNVFSR